MARPWVRAALLLLVLGLLVATLVQYGAGKANDRSLSEPRHVLNNWDDYTGEDVYLWASVVETNDHAVVIAAGGVRLTITAAIPHATPGDTIQVYGTARNNHRIDPSRTIVAAQSGTHYMYGVSILAVILTITAFFRHWRLDTAHWSFARRRPDDA